MKKSLLITYFFPPKIGGIENYLKNICQNLPADKIVVMTETAPGQEKIDAAFNYSIIRKKLFPWPFFKPSWLPLIFQLKKIIKRHGIEVLQFGHYSNLVTLGLIYNKLFGRPYFVYTHGVDTLWPQKSWLQKKLMLLNLKNADWIIVNSEYMKKRLIDLGLFPAKMIVIYPSINANDGQTIINPDQIKNKYLIKDEKIILTIGRLVERKGQDMVIRSLPMVLEKYPRLRYMIVGDGPSAPNLKNLVHKLSLERFVTFTGAIEDRSEKKYPFYQLADVFVMPTREIKAQEDVESFGLVYLEAQAAGCPVIIGRAGGTKETIVEGVTGFAVNPENEQEIAECIIKILSDKVLRKTMSEKGKEWVTGTFNWNKQIKKLFFVLEDLSVDKDSKFQPAISVIIPAYQSAKTIDSTLASIYQQKFSDYEIILVNDGSTDTLLDLLKKYGDQISVISQENRGAAAARNKGAAKAKGKYLFFCDADIILNPLCLEKMVRALELNPFASFCYSSFLFGRHMFKALPYSVDRLKRLNYISTMSMLRSRDFIGFDETLKRFQDWDLWLRLAKLGKTGLAWPEFLFKGPLIRAGISGQNRNKEQAVNIIKKKHNLP